MKILATIFANDVIVGNIFPLHEIIIYFLDNRLLASEDKILRYQQYVYFQKRRNPKFDFLELGVLEKFPYPGSAAGAPKQQE